MAETRTVHQHEGRVKAVQLHIHQHLDQPLDRRVLASIAGFSVSHFHRIFAALEGETVAGYTRRLRLKRAAYKLRAGAVDITEVALAAGYSSHAAFSKAFRQQYSLSPSQFRQLGCAAATELLRKVTSHENQT